MADIQISTLNSTDEVVSYDDQNSTVNQDLDVVDEQTPQ